jgi:hypothetical protein
MKAPGLAAAVTKALGIWINEFNQKVALPTDNP